MMVENEAVSERIFASLSHALSPCTRAGRVLFMPASIMLNVE